MTTAYPYRNRSLNGLGLFWDENLEVPTIYLDDAPVEEYPIYDTRDYWATGDSWNSIDSTVLDTRDVWAQDGAPVYTMTDAGSDWSWTDMLRTGVDLLKTGAGVAQEYLRYQTTQLPGGGRVYTRYDQYGYPMTGGRTVMVGGGLMDTLKQYAPVLMLGGVALAVVASAGNRRK